MNGTGNTGLRVVGGTGTGLGSYLSLQAQGGNAALIGTEAAITGSGTSTNLMLFGYGSNSVIFAPATAEAMRLDSSGNLLVGVATANANGGVLQLKSGITFPATAVAATDANTLDDYEEGTWTPTDASGAGLTLSVTSANYTKIGNTVRLSAFITFPTTVSGASVLLGGLPYVSANYSIGAVRSTVACGATALSSNIYVNDPFNTAITNVQLTGSLFIFTVVYNV